MTINSAKAYHTDQVHYLRTTVSQAASISGTAVSLGWIPAGAAVIDGGAVVFEAFDSGTSDVLDLGFRNAGDGTADDTDEFATDLAISAVGLKAADELATAGDLLFPEGAEIVATWTGAGTAATAGSAVVWVAYMADNTD